MSELKTQSEQYEAKEKALIERELELKKKEKLLKLLEERKLTDEHEFNKFFESSKKMYQELSKMKEQPSNEEDISDPKVKEVYNFMQGQKAKEAKQAILNAIEESKEDYKLVNAYIKNKNNKENFLEIIMEQANPSNPDDLREVLALHETNFKDSYDAFKEIDGSEVEQDNKSEHELENNIKKDLTDDDFMDNIINEKMGLDVQPSNVDSSNVDSSNVNVDSSNAPPASLDIKEGSSNSRDFSKMSEVERSDAIKRDVLSKI